MTPLTKEEVAEIRRDIEETQGMAEKSSLASMFRQHCVDLLAERDALRSPQVSAKGGTMAVYTDPELPKKVAELDNGADAEAAARRIIKKISDAALELAFTRHDLTSDEFDETNYPDVGGARQSEQAFEKFIEEVKEDTLACLTGDDTGCLDPEELSTENCELLWLASLIIEREAQPQWSSEPPTTQGWYWHWDGDPGSAPFPLSVLKHGAGKQNCFVSLGQAGLSRSIECDKYGGYWMPVTLPKPPKQARKE
jgi:hypothetical protein